MTFLCYYVGIVFVTIKFIKHTYWFWLLIVVKEIVTRKSLLVDLLYPNHTT